MSEMKDNVGKEVLRTALLRAAGELSTHKQHEKKHPQTVYEDLIKAAQEGMKKDGRVAETHPEPNLGCATTRKLLEEVKARIEVDGRLDYRTVDD